MFGTTPSTQQLPCRARRVQTEARKKVTSGLAHGSSKSRARRTLRLVYTNVRQQAAGLQRCSLCSLGRCKQPALCTAEVLSTVVRSASHQSPSESARARAAWSASEKPMCTMNCRMPPQRSLQYCTGGQPGGEFRLGVAVESWIKTHAGSGYACHAHDTQRHQHGCTRTAVELAPVRLA